MSVTFDLVVWPWPFVKFKKADVIGCRLLYCTLVPGMMSMGLLPYKIHHITICLFYLTFDLHLWPLAFVKVTYTLIIICILCCWMFVPKMKFVAPVEFEIWTFVWRKPKWIHYGVIANLILMKFTYESAKSVWKRRTKFQFDQT